MHRHKVFAVLLLYLPDDVDKPFVLFLTSRNPQEVDLVTDITAVIA